MLFNCKEEVSKVAEKTYLIIGLGNPGSEYCKNRHNIGFMVVDTLCASWNIGASRLKHKALIAETKYLDERVICAKPQTFMNNSGNPVVTLAKYYKVPLENMLVIYDELDLPLGTIRLRAGGSAAGHHGMESIIAKLGSNDFPRLRIGIDRPRRQSQIMDYVLHDFSRAEQQFLPSVLETAVKAIETYLSEGIENAMNRFNGETIND